MKKEEVNASGDANHFSPMSHFYTPAKVLWYTLTSKFLIHCLINNWYYSKIWKNKFMMKNISNMQATRRMLFWLWWDKNTLTEISPKWDTTTTPVTIFKYYIRRFCCWWQKLSKQRIWEAFPLSLFSEKFVDTKVQ